MVQLIIAIADVFDYDVRYDDVERPVWKRQVVALDESKVESVLKNAQIFDVHSHHVAARPRRSGELTCYYSCSSADVQDAGALKLPPRAQQPNDLSGLGFTGLDIEALGRSPPMLVRDRLFLRESHVRFRARLPTGTESSLADGQPLPD
jgi:hypothetical protein